MRKTAVALIIRPFVGCGDSSAPEDVSFAPENLVGIWHATSFNGDSLPGPVTTNDDVTFLWESVVIELELGGTGVLTISDGLFESENDLTWAVTSEENGEFTVTFDDVDLTLGGRYNDGVLRLIDEDTNEFVFERGSG